MEGTFGRFITSPLFTFQIGPEKKEFTVHSQPLAQLSDVLDKLMNGNMLEAKTRRVDWSDVDEDTFVRLCEYAYLQNYTPPLPVCAEDVQRDLLEPTDVVDGVPPADEPEPEPQPVPESVPEPEPEPEPVPEPWSESEISRRLARLHEANKRRKRERTGDQDLLPCKEKSIWTRHLQESFSFLHMTITLRHAHQPREAHFYPQKNTKHQDFTPVFLGHARLYLLADKYLIDALRQLALCKMAQTLDKFGLYRQSVPALIEFVRFVYADAVRNAHAIEALRNLATTYVVSSLGYFGDDDNFQALLEEGGAFVADFWRAVWKAN